MTVPFNPIQEAKGFAVIDLEGLLPQTVAKTRVGAIVNYLAAAGGMIVQQVPDEKIEAVWKSACEDFDHKGHPPPLLVEVEIKSVRISEAPA